MKVVVVLFAIVCIVSFAWGRKSFFKNTAVKNRVRGGLGPLGTIFGFAMIFTFAFVDYAGVRVAAGFVLVLHFLSLALFWWAVQSFGAQRPNIAFTPGVPSALVVCGAYRFFRHPFYVSYLLFWCSGFFLHREVYVASIPLIMGVIYFRAARDEERQIQCSPLAGEYEAYKKRVGMFFPRLSVFLGQR